MEKESVLNENKRESWLDMIKGIAMLFVVFGHVLLGFTNNNAFPNEQDTFLVLMNWIYSFHMPLFIFVSGYAFYLSCYKDGKDREKIKRQSVNITIVFFEFQILLCVLKIIFSSFVDNKMSIGNALLNIILPDTLMWYLWTIILYYLFFCILYDSSELKWYLAVGLVLNVSVQILSGYINIRFCLKEALIYFFYFVLGFYMARKKKEKVNDKLLWLMAGLITVLFIVYIIGYDFIVNNNTLQLDLVYRFVMSLLMIFGLYFSSRQVNINNKIITWIGRNSLIIYLLHTYIVTAMKVVIIKAGFFNPWAACLVCFAVPLCVCAVAVFIINRSKLLQLIFMPVKTYEQMKRNKTEVDK